MLVTFEEVATWCDKSASDLTIQRFTLAADAFVKRYCGREFERARRIEYVRGFGGDTVHLLEEPISTIHEVRIDASQKLGSDAIVADLTIFVTVADALIYPGGVFPDGRRSVMVDYTAGYYPASDSDNTHVRVPEDLRTVAFELVAGMMRRGSAETFAAGTIGNTQTYQRFASALTPMQRQILALYKR